MNKLILALMVLGFACSKREKNSDSGRWKELDSFHKIMAAAYHPLDSGNIQPGKKLATQLADEAEHWAAASLPEKVDNEEMKSNLEQLKTDSRSLANEVSNGAADDIIKDKLTALHRQFHKIMEAWEGHGHDEENQGHKDDGDDEDEDGD